MSDWFNFIWKGLSWFIGAVRNMYAVLFFTYAGLIMLFAQFVKALFAKLEPIVASFESAIENNGETNIIVDSGTYGHQGYGTAWPLDVAKFANAFIDVQFLCAIMFAIIALRGFFFAYRLLKSWIPTLAG